MSDTLRITACPLEVSPGDIRANLNAAETAMQAAATFRPDIVVFPELMNSGFVSSADAMRSLAERADGLTMQTVRRMAGEHDCAIAGSYDALAEDGSCRNRAFFVEPDGRTTLYDKKHLFSLSKEAHIFRRGDKATPVAEFRGWKVALNVCYDLRFPVWMRNAGYAYDAMLLPANWPASRAYALEHLLIARAIENQAPIVCANLAGSDRFGTYDDCTFAFDHTGQPAFLPGIFTADFSLQAIREARDYMPCMRDADDFTVRL